MLIFQSASWLRQVMLSVSVPVAVTEQALSTRDNLTDYGLGRFLDVELLARPEALYFLVTSAAAQGGGDITAGFTTESPSGRFVILAESGRCESLLHALEIRAAAGYRVVQCWGSGGVPGFLSAGGNVALTYVLLEKVGQSRRRKA